MAGGLVHISAVEQRPELEWQVDPSEGLQVVRAHLEGYLAEWPLHGAAVEIHGLSGPVTSAISEDGSREDTVDGEKLNGLKGAASFSDYAHGDHGSLYIVETFEGGYYYIPEANLQRFAPDSPEEGGFDLLSPPAEEWIVQKFALEVVERLHYKGYCVVKQMGSDMPREALKEHVGSRKGWSRIRPDFEKALMGSNPQSLVSSVTEQDLDPESPHAAYLQSMMQSCETLATVTESLGYSCSSEPHLTVLRKRADRFHREEEEVNIDVQVMLDFVRRRKLCFMHFITGSPAEQGSIELRPRDDPDRVTILPVLVGTFIVFRHDLFDYSYSPAASEVVLQTWLLQQPAEVTFHRIEGDEEDVLAVFGHSGECARIPSSEEIHVMSVGSVIGGKTNGDDEAFIAYSALTDLFIAIPHERWDHDLYYSEDLSRGLAVCKHCAMIDSNLLNSFDPEFFGISQETAETMHRNDFKLFEVTYETLYKGGHTKESLKGTELMMAFGDMGRDMNFKRNMVRVLPSLGGSPDKMGIGNAQHHIVHYVASIFGTTGPCFMLDTACSATTTATGLIHSELKRTRDATKHLDRGRAITEGVSAGMNWTDDPGAFIGMSQARMLGMKGRSLTFDMSAGGYARGENAVCAFFKLSSDTTTAAFQKAALLGSMINQDGRSASLTAPNGPSQTLCIRGSLKDARSDPIEVAFGEMHGTGTALGDPIEVGAMTNVMKTRGGAALPFPNLSGKTMTGHCEIGAGLNAQIKTLASLERLTLPGSCHLNELNHHIEYEGYPALWLSECVKLHRENNQAGLSSFGFGGTNTRIDMWASGKVSYYGREVPRLTISQLGTAIAVLPHAVKKESLNFERVGRILVTCPRCLNQMCIHCREAYTDATAFQVHQCKLIREETASYDVCSSCYTGKYIHGVAVSSAGSAIGNLYLVGSWGKDHLTMTEGTDDNGDAIFTANVKLGEPRQECFYILQNDDKNMAMYPVSEEAGQHSDIAGPNLNSGNKFWTIDGLSDGMPQGTVYKITLTWNYEQRRIEWRPVSGFGKEELLMVGDG
jgi:polyketide synthase-associated protein